ncbi:MAG: YbaB/EbfC family nucleoid-associated protein [Fuerstiella sp.]|nr:YbaB/EbfC family nucleoid-associated protein [Fuerstiella sp.]
MRPPNGGLSEFEIRGEPPDWYRGNIVLKGLGNITSMMKQASEMQGRLAEAKDKVAGIRVIGIAGGEMVKVEATGDMKILSVSIESSLMETGDHEMVEELVTAATNQALQKAKDAAASAMSDVAAGMDIPDLNEALSKLGMGG